LPKPHYRDSAQEHLDAAKALLADSGGQSVRYACLELRMCVEALTYLNLEAYLTEVPNTVMKKWTPKQVIDELLAVDPTADQSVHVRIGVEEVIGTPSRDMKYLGEDRRFTVKWANKAHNTLSNFLHEPTIYAHEKGGAADDITMREKAAEIIEELEAVTSSVIWNVNFSVFTEFKCGCGWTIKRKPEHLQTGSLVVCGNVDCGKQYVYSPEPDGKHLFTPDQHSYICNVCNEKRFIDTHKLKKLPIVVCDGCGSKAQTSMEYLLTPIERPLLDNEKPSQAGCDP
jgi:hypothetical protein